MGYYADQLNKIKPDSNSYEADVKITNNGISTHWLSLNTESANELVKWLKENYRIVETPQMITLHREPTPSEVRFGEGAIHYKDFERSFVTRRDGSLKLYVVCPQDGLRYYRSRN